MYGGVNFALPDRQAQSETIERIAHHYQASASHVDHLDGLSMQFAAEGWRFNYAVPTRNLCCV